MFVWFFCVCVKLADGHFKVWTWNDHLYTESDQIYI